MRIWYQSLIEPGLVPTYFDGMAARARRIARAGVEVEFHGMPEGTYGGRVPADVVIYPYIMSLHHQFILDNALRAQAEGYDAFAIGSIQDPALEEARSLVDIPVVGYGESAMHLACLMGSRFCIIAFQPLLGQLLERRIRLLDLERRALPTLFMDIEFADVTRGLQDPAHLADRFVTAARRAIAAGAEAIIPGQLYLSEAVAAAGLSRVDDAPVVDALAATLKMAEVMVDLRGLGISVARRGFFHARPDLAMVEHARRVHGRRPIPRSGGAG
ncbi:MAG: hypothetical protein HY725_05195 [Candidatus Rokubacteria bacterium]|nr:hypothetical protein [Candidatus Rokubacteria bacterium]